MMPQFIRTTTGTLVNLDKVATITTEVYDNGRHERTVIIGEKGIVLGQVFPERARDLVGAFVPAWPGTRAWAIQIIDDEPMVTEHDVVAWHCEGSDQTRPVLATEITDDENAIFLVKMPDGRYASWPVGRYDSINEAKEELLRRTRQMLKPPFKGP
jgi:hypothetical protein